MEFTGGVTFHSLLVTRCKITRYSLQNSLVTVTEITRCKNLLVTRCRSCSLQQSLITCCKIRSLRVEEITRCKNSLVNRYRSCSLQKNRSLVVAKFACYSLQQITCYSMQKIIHQSLK